MKITGLKKLRTYNDVKKERIEKYLKKMNTYTLADMLYEIRYHKSIIREETEYE